MNSRIPGVIGGFFAATLLLLGTSLSTSGRAYSGGPDPGATGGFKEPTCHQSGCHDSFDLNAGSSAGLGDLLISGFPEHYEPGTTYPVTLAISHTQDRRYWGFQLAARLQSTGAQAGQLQPVDSGTQVQEKDGIRYFAHSLDGIDTNTFEFTWVAPAKGAGPVVINAAGNAADGGGSPLDDYIYSTALTVEAQK